MTMTSMRSPGMRGVIGTVAVLLCLAAMAAAAWFAIVRLGMGRDLPSLVLAALLVSAGVLGVNAVLTAVDDWLDGAAGDGARERDAPR
jgi:hypothetical protein